jgi:hypothetical protein
MLLYGRLVLQPLTIIMEEELLRKTVVLFSCTVQVIHYKVLLQCFMMRKWMELAVFFRTRNQSVRRENPLTVKKTF